MPRYSDDLIADIFAANDIIDYVSKYVSLKKNGRDYMGLCPFHHEKTPSFHVSSDKQLFHCFGCGAGGNLIQFVMKSENLDFTDALKLLADNAGIVLPEEATHDDKRHEMRKRIYEMNKTAARFFYKSLVSEETGSIAQQYLKERQLTAQTVKTYGIGYAPESYDALLNHLRENGYNDDEIVSASLAVSRNGKIYDKFRGRLMFPIIDTRGNIIGFGGRIITETPENSEYKPPKYLNSGETIAFDKGKNLFSLNLAKKADTKQLILCEGYMDVISVYQAGVHNIVATLGTALTENQAKIMCRYAGEILICYDMDEAGRKAVMRAIDIFANVGGRTKVVKLKGAKDPDEYIKKYGVAMFKKALDEAMPSTEFKISVARPEFDISDTDGKIRFLSEAAKILSGVKDPIEVDAYINNLSTETGIGKEAIYSEYRKHCSVANSNNSTVKRQLVKSDSVLRNESSLQKTEIELLNLIARDGHVYRAVCEYIKPEDYSSDVLKKIAEYIYDCRASGKEPYPAAVMNEFSSDEDVGIASSVFYVLAQCGDIHNGVEQMVKKLLKEKLDIKAKECKNDIAAIGDIIAKRRNVDNIKLSWD